MVSLDSSDSPLFRRVYAGLAWFALAGAAWVAVRAWRLGWPPGALKAALALAGMGAAGLLGVALAPPPTPKRRRDAEGDRAA